MPRQCAALIFGRWGTVKGGWAYPSSPEGFGFARRPSTACRRLSGRNRPARGMSLSAPRRNSSGPGMSHSGRGMSGSGRGMNSSGRGMNSSGRGMSSSGPGMNPSVRGMGHPVRRMSGSGQGTGHRGSVTSDMLLARLLRILRFVWPLRCRIHVRPREPVAGPWSCRCRYSSLIARNALLPRLSPLVPRPSFRLHPLWRIPTKSGRLAARCLS